MSESMITKARLSGNSVDLDALKHLFSDREVLQIGHDDDGYYLTAPELSALFEDGRGLSEAATKLLRRANGIARALDPGFRPVTLVGRFHIGDRVHVIAAVDTAEAREVALPVTAVIHGVPQVSARPPGSHYAKLVSEHADVAEVMDILGKDVIAINLFDLYKVYEIIRQNIGGPNPGAAKVALIEKGWVSRADIDAFINTANTASISGEEARHARGVPRSADGMTLHQARSTISVLVTRWMESF
jgi:hypothetical protein